MAVLPTLVPTGQVAAGGWDDEAGGTTNLHLAIDETGAADTAYIRTVVDAIAAAGVWELTDTPSDFATMTSISLEIRHSRGSVEAGSAGAGDDTWTLFAQIVNSAGSPLTNEMNIESAASGWAVKTEVVAFTGVVAGDKATWDGARLQLRADYTQNMGKDGHRVWVDFARIINGVYALAPGPLSQAGYRWRNDDGSQTAATWKAAENTGPGTLALDANHRLRFVVDETGGTNPVDNLQLQLQYRKNGGTYANVNASSTNVRSAVSTQFAEEAATTRQLTSGTGTFVTGAMDEDEGLAGEGNQIDLAAGNLTEVEYCFQLRSADLVAGDVLEFRLVKPGTVLLENYAQTPSYTIPTLPGWGPDGTSARSDPGPHRAPDGNYYVPYRSSADADNISIWKSADGVAWSSVGTITGINSNNEARQTTSVMGADGILHIAWTAIKVGNTGVLLYAAWDTNDDTEAVAAEEVDNTTAIAITSSETKPGIGVRANGEVVIAYARITASSNEEAHFAWRSTGGTWTVVLVDTTDRWFSADVVIDGNDNAHGFFTRFAVTGGIGHSVLRANNTLSSLQMVTTAGPTGAGAQNCFAGKGHGRLFVMQTTGSAPGNIIAWHSDAISEAPTWTSTDFSQDAMDAPSSWGEAVLKSGGGRIVVAWIRDSDQAIQYRQWDNATPEWDAVVTTGDTQTVESVHSHMSVTNDGVDVLLWVGSQVADAGDQNMDIRSIALGPVLEEEVPFIPPGHKKREEKRKAKKLVVKKREEALRRERHRAVVRRTRSAARFGTGYLVGFNASGQGAFTPDSADYDVLTGNLQIIFGAALNHITGKATSDNIITKGDTSSAGVGSWILRKPASVRTLQFNWRESGGTIRSISITTAFPNVIGQFRWYKLEFDASTATGTLYISDEPSSTPVESITWNLHGSDTDAVATDIATGSADIWLGNRADNPDEYLDGQLAYVEVRNGIGGTKVLEADFRYRTDLHNYLNTPDDTGNAATTPDHSSLDVLGDVDLRADAMAPDWTQSTNRKLICKLDASAGYELLLSNTDPWPLRLAIRRSTAELQSVNATVGVPVADNGRIQVRATLDVSNGANRVITFYYRLDVSKDLIDNTGWTQLGDVVSLLGNTDIGANDDALVLGSDIDLAGNEWDGRIYQASVMDGIDGTVVAYADFRNESLKTGNSELTDSTGKVWTITSAASWGFDSTQLWDQTGKLWTIAAPSYWVLPLQPAEPEVEAPSIDLDHIGPTSVVNAVQVNGSITGAHIGPTSTLNAPSLRATIVGAHIGPVAALNQPSVRGQISLNHIGPTSVVNAPTGRGQIALAHIGPVSVLNAPSVRGRVVLAHIGPTSVVNAPVAIYGPIVLSHIGPTSVLFAPSLTAPIELAHIGPTSALFAPTLVVAITVPHLGPVSAANAPRLFLSTSLVPVLEVSNDGWDTGPTPGGDIIDALEAEDSDYITVTV